MAVGLSRRRVLAMKKETTPGTDALATITAADILWAFNIRPASRIEAITVLAQSGFLGDLRSLSGQEIFGLTGEILARGAGALYSSSVVPDADAIYRAGGMLATLDATPGSEKWTYTPLSSPNSREYFSAAMLQENGPTHKGLRCVATFTKTYRAGQPGLIAFTLAGILAAEAAHAFVTKAPTTLQHPVFKSAQFQIDAANFAAKIQNVAFDKANALSIRDDANALGSIAGFEITGHAPGGSFDPEVDLAATYDWFTKWKDKPAGIDLGWQLGGVQYNRHKVTMPQISIHDRGWGERNAMAAFQVVYRAHPNIGDDEVSIVYD